MIDIPGVLGTQESAPASSLSRAGGNDPGGSQFTWAADRAASPLARALARWRRRAAHRLVHKADRARDQGDCARAASLYRRALALAPGRSDIRVQLAHMLKELTRFGEAEAAYRQALTQSPEDGDIHLQLGHLLKLLGRTGDATAAYFAAHRLLHSSEVAAVELRALGALPPAIDPGRAGIVAAEEHIAEGNRLRDAGRCAEAAAAYGCALGLMPTRTDICIQYGNMLKDSGRLADAEQAYRTALAQAPENAESHLQLGHLFKLQGRRAEALAAYRRATEMQPSLQAAWAELFYAGCPQAQQQYFEMQAARGSIETLTAMTEEVARLQNAVARLAATLPDICAQMALPIAAYDRFRRVYDVPAPPPAAIERRFGIVMAVGGAKLATLYAQIATLTAQTYRNWRLCVVGSDADHRRMVERAAASDPRIRWMEAAADEPPAAAERRVARDFVVDWLILPASGAQLDRQALAWCAASIGLGTAAAFVTDEEAVVAVADGPQRSSPQLRQVVDYDTLLEANPFGETVIVERAAYAEVADALIAGSFSAARSSLLLSLASRGTVGHIPLPLVRVDPTDADGERQRTGAAERAAAHELAVRAHLAGEGAGGRTAIGPIEDTAMPLPIVWQPNRPQQIVQVIIPTRDNGGDLRDFVASLRRHAAVPGALRVLIVANGSCQPETARILAELNVESWIEIAHIDEPFNWSRLNNRAVALTEAALLVFANDDMLMLSDGWDRQLRGLLERPEIGAVGARLVYPDDSLQHAGILLGWPDIDVHDGRHEPTSSPGPGRRWHVSRAVSAVTGAFVAMRREAFEASGGFDEAGLPVAYGDIDLALKLRARGLKILWTPSLTLRHFESKSRGLDHLDREKRVRNAAERQVLEERWGTALEADPSVNPAWHAATLPFRLISAPPQARLWRHIRTCAAADPWLPEYGPQRGGTPIGEAGGPQPLDLYPLEFGR